MRDAENLIRDLRVKAMLHGSGTYKSSFYFTHDDVPCILSFITPNIAQLNYMRQNTPLIVLGLI